MIDVIKYLLCAGAGLGVGYYIAQRRLHEQYFLLLQKETEEAREFYRRKYVEDAAADGENPEVTLSALDAAEALKQYQGIDIAPSVLTNEMTDSVNRAVMVDREEEEKSDAPQVPDEVPKQPTGPTTSSVSIPKEPVHYNQISTPAAKPEEKKPSVQVDVITVQDFIENQTQYKQYSVTYYAGDDILAGESDQIVDREIRNVTVGEEILQKLAEGPESMGGSDLMYIRNHSEKMEFEIARSDGEYSVEVLNEPRVETPNESG